MLPESQLEAVAKNSREIIETTKETVHVVKKSIPQCYKKIHSKQY